jgi:histidinol-phosphatase
MSYTDSADAAKSSGPPGGDLGADLQLGLELAELADAVTRRWWRNPGLTARRKSDGTIVTPADEQVEEVLRVRLAAARPADAVLGEEQGLSGPHGASRMWVLDPIDGTAHFLRGRIGFATLISLLIGGVPVVGVISMPARGSRWWGAVGLDADSTGGPLHVSHAASLRDSAVVVAEPLSWGEHQRGLELVHTEAAETYPAADVGLFCDVAEGRADAALIPSGDVWDLAAPYAVVTAAGGLCSDLTGTPRPDGRALVAAAPRLHAQVLVLLNSATRT